MKDNPDPLETDRQFFTFLIDGDLESLNRLLTDDFVLIDTLNGSRVTKSALLSAIESGELQFTAIEMLGADLRRHHTTAVITGRTHIAGRYGDTAFEVHSRYTHVYIEQHFHWRLLSAQGTKVLE